jgi:hypothetical protein
MRMYECLKMRGYCVWPVKVSLHAELMVIRLSVVFGRDHSQTMSAHLPVPFELDEILIASLAPHLDPYGHYALSLTCRRLRSCLILPADGNPATRLVRRTDLVTVVAVHGYAKPFLELARDCDDPVFLLSGLSPPHARGAYDCLLATAVRARDQPLARQITNVFVNSGIWRRFKREWAHGDLPVLIDALFSICKSGGDYYRVRRWVRVQMMRTGCCTPLALVSSFPALFTQNGIQCPGHRTFRDLLLDFVGDCQGDPSFVGSARHALLLDGSSSAQRRVNCHELFRHLAWLQQLLPAASFAGDVLPLLVRFIDDKPEWARIYMDAWMNVVCRKQPVERILSWIAEMPAFPPHLPPPWDWPRAFPPFRWLPEWDWLFAPDSPSIIDKEPVIAYIGNVGTTTSRCGILRIAHPAAIASLRDNWEDWVECAAMSRHIRPETWAALLSSPRRPTEPLCFIHSDTLMAFISVFPLDWNVRIQFSHMIGDIAPAAAAAAAPVDAADIERAMNLARQLPSAALLVDAMTITPHANNHCERAIQSIVVRRLLDMFRES